MTQWKNAVHTVWHKYANNPPKEQCHNHEKWYFLDRFEKVLWTFDTF